MSSVEEIDAKGHLGGEFGEREGEQASAIIVFGII